MNGRCGTCRFFFNKDQKGTHVGACRRNPPQVIVLYGADLAGNPTQQLQPVFPTMNTEHGWCGEFVARVELAKGVA